MAMLALRRWPASIAEHGLLQPHIVSPSASKKTLYDVHAGGRRWRAIGLLIERGVLPKDYAIDVRLCESEDAAAREISLAENLIREAMTPTDEARAYKDIIAEGTDAEAVARRFGVTVRHVQWPPCAWPTLPSLSSLRWPRAKSRSTSPWPMARPVTANGSRRRGNACRRAGSATTRRQSAVRLPRKRCRLAYAVSQSLKASLASGTHASAFQSRLGAHIGIDIAQHWRPGAENFFDRIKKSQILGILGQFDAELALRYASAKKTELASAAARLCAGDTIIEPEIKARAIAWVPGAMCFVDTGPRVDADPNFDDGSGLNVLAPDVSVRRAGRTKCASRTCLWRRVSRRSSQQILLIAGAATLAGHRHHHQDNSKTENEYCAPRGVEQGGVWQSRKVESRMPNDERTIEILVDDAQFGEGPRWHDGALWFPTSVPVLRYVEYFLMVGEVVLAGLTTPSGLGWTRNGDLLVTSLFNSTMSRVGSDGVPRVVCGPEQRGTLNTNDMATAGSCSCITSSGRIYRAGISHAELGQPTGSIILYDHDTGAARIVTSGHRMPNGIAITPDGKGLIVAELYASRILRFDIAPDGSLLNETVFAQLENHPDGLCLDSEGAVWVGTTGSQKFERVDDTGKILDSVAVPGWGCVACMLGGEDGRTLFMVASQTNTPDDIFEGRAKSRILMTRVDVPAAAEPVWP